MKNIGTIAGKVWKMLSSNGKMTVTGLTKKTSEKKDQILMALGWLSKEDKLDVTKKGNITYYNLK
ncbi:MAG: winged helix-turn-helix domain-containing protein [Candidatus Marinimicrobia bacterium]|nr:winged helix-turn-helix domain-containing protein [Candidatus Neomarinimicrobiota bacterium]